MEKKSLSQRGDEVLSPVLTHATTLEIAKGKGIYLYDKSGREFMDFASGIAATATGHCHPKVVSAAQAQMGTLIHACSGVVYYDQNIALAEKLKEITPAGLDMTFFTQSGSEAIEASLKLAKYVSKKQALIAFGGSFHGRTLGALSVTFSNPKYREGYEPLIPNIYLSRYAYCYRCEKKVPGFDPSVEGDDFPSTKGCAMQCLQELEVAIKGIKSPGPAAIVMEPIQGEGGYIVPPKKFVQGVRELCDKYKALLIFDEVQTGFGRTGRMFASEHFEVSPDIMAMAKAIASGLPLGASIARGELMRSWTPGAHGGTMTGNPVTCAASLATIDVLQTEGLIENAKNIGKYLKGKLAAMAKSHKTIGDVRGTGLMIGVEFIKPGGIEPNPDIVKKIKDLCLKDGLILINCGSHGQVIRLVPALLVTKDEVDRAMDIFGRALAEAEKV